MNLEETVDRYCEELESTGNVGLVVLEAPDQITEVRERLLHNEVIESRTWWSALERLREKCTTFMVLDWHISLEAIDLIEQIACSVDQVEVVDRFTREVQVAPNEGKLLLVTSREVHHTLKSVFPVLGKVKMIS